MSELFKEGQSADGLSGQLGNVGDDLEIEGEVFHHPLVVPEVAVLPVGAEPFVVVIHAILGLVGHVLLLAQIVLQFIFTLLFKAEWFKVSERDAATDRLDIKPAKRGVSASSGQPGSGKRGRERENQGRLNFFLLV